MAGTAADEPANVDADYGDDDDIARQVQALEARHVLQTYKRQPVVLARGEGSRVCSTSTGASTSTSFPASASSCLGTRTRARRRHRGPGTTLIQTSNLYYHPLQGQLAARLAALSGLQRTFFCNSGTEAVEACLKFARRYWFSQGETTRTSYVALQHGFSGRTMGALSVTSNPHTASRSSR